MQIEHAFSIRRRIVPALFSVFCCVLLAACGTFGASPVAGDSREQSETLVTEWYYEHLDEDHRNAYDAFRRSASDPFSPELSVILDSEGKEEEISTGELDSVYQGFLYDHPELFWLDRTYRFRIRSTGEAQTADAVGVIPLCGSAEEISQYTERFTEASDALLKQLGTSSGDGKDTAEIYDILAGHTAFAEEALFEESMVHAHTAYGAIVEGSAVCDGYALALKYLMNCRGIECIVIPGTVNGAAHVWNTAFWDGRWHEMDITWDAAGKDSIQYKEGTQYKEGMQYFDLTTEEMERDHIREPEGIGTMVPVSEVRKSASFPNRSAL